MLPTSSPRCTRGVLCRWRPHLASCIPTIIPPFLTLHSHSVRKSIARVLTVVHQNQRSALKEAYKGKVRGFWGAHITLCSNTCTCIMSYHPFFVTNPSSPHTPLQYTEVCAFGFASKEDPCHPPSLDKAPGIIEDRKGAEKGTSIPPAQVCCATVGDYDTAVCAVDLFCCVCL